LPKTSAVARSGAPRFPPSATTSGFALARIAEKTKRIKFGPSVLIPSYRHPMAQASAIATIQQIAPGRLMVGFGTGFAGRAGMGLKPLALAAMRMHIGQVKALPRWGSLARRGRAAGTAQCGTDRRAGRGGRRVGGRPGCRDWRTRRRSRLGVSRECHRLQPGLAAGRFGTRRTRRDR
jgi:hypothetical protein